MLPLIWRKIDEAAFWGLALIVVAITLLSPDPPEPPSP